MEKLIVCIMGQNCEKFIGMCLKSVKKADAIVFCDGGSIDKTLEIVNNYKVDVIYQDYNQKDKEMNGKQRNFYLNYLKENYPNDWALCIDADEVVENLNEIKKFINQAKPGVYSPRMRHLIGNLAHEDATLETHYVLNRLFKISEVDKYPKQEHPILIPKNQENGIGINKLVIWHLSHIAEMFNVKNKYQNHLNKSKIHTKDFLRGWYFNHIFGLYPTKRFNVGELPEVILNEFGIPKDEMYFIGRGSMEVKHYQDAINWKEFFNLKSCLVYGCGLGQRVYTLNKLGVDTVGVEKSEYAVKQKLDKNIYQGNIVDSWEGLFDLTVAFDVLEHLEYNELEDAINSLITNSKKYILVSVPVLGNPALYIDNTHKIFESEEWWLKQFENKGLKRIKTPEHFLYKEQVYIFEK